MSSEKNDKVRIKTFVLGPLQANCYLVYDPDSLKGAIIDPGWPDGSIVKAIEDTGVEICHLINTHGHADHIAGNSCFKVPARIHPLDESCLSDPVKNMSFFTGFPVRLEGPHSPLEEGEILSFGKFFLEVIHTPGHTPGGISLKCGSNLFTGDTLFFEGIGRTDLPGGDIGTILDSIVRKLMKFPDHFMVFPGHGCRTDVGSARCYISSEFGDISPCSREQNGNHD